MLLWIEEWSDSRIDVALSSYGVMMRLVGLSALGKGVVRLGQS
jgi:hypothetical protein